MSSKVGSKDFKGGFSGRCFSVLWDLWCAVSVVGIWPRWVEPRLLAFSSHELSLPRLHPDLHGIKILFFSDLHLQESSSSTFLAKVKNKILHKKPDLILFGGDFISFSNLCQRDLMESFLADLKAPLGSYACLGNHDYAQYVSLTSDGTYNLVCPQKKPVLKRAFGKLFRKHRFLDRPHPDLQPLEFHSELMEVLSKSPFEVLENRTVQIQKGKGRLNLSGLGDSWALCCRPEDAFENYEHEHPGLVLSHNPNTFLDLKDGPGDLFLSGHTHGGQINLPFILQRFSALKDPRFKKGFTQEGDKTLYVSRGVGSQLDFRCFASPQISLLTLVSEVS